MIEAHELTKRYGNKTAVHTLSFTVAPGTVTGFLDPNGAGKSTTMRMIMGLDRPTSGTVTVNGKPYGQHRSPLGEVGALLDAKAVHPGRSARSHLRTMAAITVFWILRFKRPGLRCGRSGATPLSLIL
ncbi:ATP-binding cassette domain-containing protein, partial [Kocuria rhizosphaericola]|uniref:ATP-binding cassette domain-containing protein n=1 Tax=Kocuria rhizosphaericola TaxID=3376284 RepID=UPI003795EFD9